MNADDSRLPAAAVLERLRGSYNYLFNSGLSISKIKDAALSARFLPSSAEGTAVAGRSIAWKLFLTPEEPLQSSSTTRRTLLLDFLRGSRQKYVQLLAEKMRAPDGSYEDGFVIPGPNQPPRSPGRQAKTTWNLETNNPLSLHRENPWREWFTSIELRKTILQDVERTFPDIDFFRDGKVQAELTNILFLYSSLCPSIGYRQGMHEILAPLYHAVQFDSVQHNEGLSAEDAELAEICSRVWVAADAWMLFDTLMHGISKWYEWRESPSASPTNIASPASSRGHPFSDGQVEIKAYIAPIVETCDRIQSHILRTADPLLYKHMQAVGIEPQIYGIRWLRLLFTREFNMEDAMKLWDGLFACDPTCQLAQWVCVAMLIRIRNELITADYSGQLSVLLHYPSPHPQVSVDGAPHHTTLLLRQAIALQMSPMPSAGISLMMENRNLLNIPMDVPVPSPLLWRNQSFNGLDNAAPVSSRPLQRHSRQQASQPMGLPETIARGLRERGESLGINKTFMSAMSELRKNIPDLSTSLIRSADASYSAFPLEDERSSGEHPWEPSSRFEMERDIARLRSVNKRLGESLEWILDVLKNEASDKEKSHAQKNEALESLSYVKDILTGKVAVGGIEESRLIRSKKDVIVKQPQISSPPSLVLEPASRQQLTVIRSSLPSRGSSGDINSVRGPSQRSASGVQLANSFTPVGQLPVRPTTTQKTSGKDSAGQKRIEMSSDPLGVLR